MEDLNLLTYELEQVNKLLMHSYQSEFTTYSRIYPWTNERQKYIHESFYNGRPSVLTVAGSGDQAITAALYGGKNIDVFDINQFALYYFDLKMAALLALELPEFLEFMPFTSKTKVSEEVCLNWENNPNLTNILKDISTHSYLFWRQLLYKKRYDQIRGYLEDLFNSPGNMKETHQPNLCANYLNPENYNKARNNIEKAHITKQVVNLDQVPNCFIDQTYDFINFSNIAQYANQVFINARNNYHASLIMYKNFLENKVLPMLNPDGTVIVNYCFYNVFDMKPKNKKAMQTTFEFNKNYERIIIPDSHDKERVIALRKTT